MCENQYFLPDRNIEVTTSMVKEFTKSFIIGCRGDLFSKMPKNTGEGVKNIPPIN